MKTIQFTLAFVLFSALTLFFFNCTDSDFLASPVYDNSVPPNGEGYNEIVENPFISTTDQPVSTFSIDADGASYSNIRRFLEDGMLPPANAIRTEEIINFFPFDYPEPPAGLPISTHGEISECPWATGHQLLRIGLQGKSIERQDMPDANFVFLVDVSGSMRGDDKLGLLKKGLKMYADHLRPQDKVGIVTYAGEAKTVLEPTLGSDKNEIKKAIDRLESGGSTNGEGGIRQAYELAEEHFINGGNNRIVLCTDGDFNVGLSNQDELVELIEEKRETGVFLSVIGVGTGNLQDGTMEQIADNGNGNYEYIDDEEQAEKVFVQEFGKFLTVAKDVKIQVFFDSTVVSEYRLIGYENRLLNNEDFEDDTKDAGEIGANQSITALYELVPAPDAPADAPALTIDLRFKSPDSDESQPLDVQVFDQGNSFAQASENHRFAATAAGYGMLLFDSQYKGTLGWNDLTDWLSTASNFDPYGHRAEFKEWIEKAKDMQ